MARRPAWTVSKDSVVCRDFSFEWNGGFALSQKQKNIANLHASIMAKTQRTALEVSSRSMQPLGKNIGAFSLKYHTFPLENVFQSSKIFEKGGPYPDLLDVTAGEAKRDERLRTSGKIIAFCLDGVQWPTEPKTLFYDYIYLQALLQNYGTDLALEAYDWFTDIAFNPNKSINCQARSVAIYKLMQQQNSWECLEDTEKWESFHREHVIG